MICEYQMADDKCGAPIVPDKTSPSGYRHEHAAEWLHWASPTIYYQGEAQTRRILKRCRVCGMTEPGNPAHIMVNGHKFVAE
jgi:hypothetical protein